MNTDASITIKHTLQAPVDSSWSRFIMAIAFHEHKTRSESQMSHDKIAGRPPTPFPSPSLEGREKVQKFLESRGSIAHSEGIYEAESTEKPEDPKLTQAEPRSLKQQYKQVTATTDQYLPCST